MFMTLKERFTLFEIIYLVIVIIGFCFTLYKTWKDGPYDDRQW